MATNSILYSPDLVPSVEDEAASLVVSRQHHVGLHRVYIHALGTDTVKHPVVLYNNTVVREHPVVLYNTVVREHPVILHNNTVVREHPVILYNNTVVREHPVVLYNTVVREHPVCRPKPKFSGRENRDKGKNK